MSTQRYISTSFWTDKWVRSLDPSERYLYLYLLTNPETNIAGVYDITIDRIAFDTGYDERTLRMMFERFVEGGKAYYLDEEWVIIPSWPRHQKIKRRDSNIAKGIDAILLNLPDNVWEFLGEIGYQYEYLEELPRAFKGLQGPSRPLNYSDSDSDTDRDTDTDSRKAPEEQALVKAGSSAQLYNEVKTLFEQEQVGGRFKSYPKEGAAIKGLIKDAQARAPDDPRAFVLGMVNAFHQLRYYDKFFAKQPFLPSALNASGIYERVLDQVRQHYEAEREIRQPVAADEEMVF